MNLYHALITRSDHENFTSGQFQLWRNAVLVFECFSLELPWLDNEINVSCIPYGEYTCVADNTGRHRFFKVLNVPGRSGIEFHVLNTVSGTEGCIGLGTGCDFSLDRSVYTLIDSDDALGYLKLLTIKEFKLTIQYAGLPF